MFRTHSVGDGKTAQLAEFITTFSVLAAPYIRDIAAAGIDPKATPLLQAH